MPLTVGNWWEYRYATSDTTTPPDFRRCVRAKSTIHQDDYYLLVDSSYHSGTLDTVYYLRNAHNVGVMELDYPPDGTQEDTLFKWPNVHSGYYYFFRQDCMLVGYDYPGFHGGESYSRYLNGSRDSWIGYVLKSDSTGLTNQVGFGPDSSFSLVNYHVMR
jgi:hypothetical protein